MSLLESVRDLVVVNSNHHALKLSIAMRDGPVSYTHLTLPTKA